MNIRFQAIHIFKGKKDAVTAEMERLKNQKNPNTTGWIEDWNTGSVETASGKLEKRNKVNKALGFYFDKDDGEKLGDAKEECRKTGIDFCAKGYVRYCIAKGLDSEGSPVFVRQV